MKFLALKIMFLVSKILGMSWVRHYARGFMNIISYNHISSFKKVILFISIEENRKTGLR